MNAPYAPAVLTAPTDTLARLALALAVVLRALRTQARRLDAWFAARKRAAQDRRDLATMSDRELADIGVSRASVDAIATGGWSRDSYC
ncbi:MAG TPA: DUF1127 domain-containing protein [Casimicrobiaceae bacterium]|jgi:uncharacterized protein YjiS (DUF1127 family)|nr:DUF1127 domain-containing protein [Casimicrobiaceae bacterium]